MVQIQTWGDAMRAVWVNVVPQIIEVLLSLIAAIIIFGAGWIVGDFIGKIVDKIISKIKLDSALREAGLEKALNKGGIKLNAGAFLGGLVKWFVIVIFFLSALQVLNLGTVADYLGNIVVDYIPNVVVAVLILLVSVVVAEVVEKAVVAVASAGHLRSSKALGTVARWAILVFAILAALLELRIAPSMIQIIFIGLVSALSVAFGLAFGLGGKEAASRVIDSTWNKLSRRD